MLNTKKNKKRDQIGVRLDRATRKRLELVAEAESRTVSGYVRRLILRALARRKAA